MRGKRGRGWRLGGWRQAWEMQEESGNMKSGMCLSAAASERTTVAKNWILPKGRLLCQVAGFVPPDAENSLHFLTPEHQLLLVDSGSAQDKVVTAVCLSLMAVSTSVNTPGYCVSTSFISSGVVLSHHSMNSDDSSAIWENVWKSPHRPLLSREPDGIC